MTNNRLKRILSIILVCLMLSPVISFATADTGTAKDNPDAGTAAGKEEENPGKDENPGSTEISDEDRAVYGDTRTEDQRKADALADAVYDTREKLLEKYTSYEFRCESGKFEMYLDAATLGVIIRDKTTGAIMKSVISEEDAEARKYSSSARAAMTGAVGIKAIYELSQADRFTQVYESDFVSCTATGNSSQILESLDNGFKAEVTFNIMIKEKVTEGKNTVEVPKTLTLSFELHVTLDDEGMHVVVPHDTIQRSEPTIHISEMYLYTLMGYTERGDREGYMILPDGNGITVDFEDFIEYGIKTAKFGAGYAERVYGQDISYVNQKKYADSALFANKDAEFVYAPFWGMVHTDTKLAVLGVVDDGDTNMQIEGNFNGVGNVIENYCGGRFIYRRAYQKPTNENAASGILTVPNIDFVNDAKITFIFATGSDANYTGLAKAYRDKLIKEDVLGGEASGKFNIRVDFLGTDKEDFLIFKRSVTTTTVSNIKEIISKLKDEKVDDMIVLYEGWQKGGVYNVPVSEYKVDSAVGTKSSIKKLSKQLKDMGIDFYLSQDTQTVNAANSAVNSGNVKALNEFTYSEKRPFEEVYTKFKLLTPLKTKSNVQSLAREFKDNGINNMAITGMASNIFSYSEKSGKKIVLQSRQSSVDLYGEALASIPDDMNVALKKPFKVFWKYMDSFLDMPLGSSMFAYSSHEIPFISIVLDGKTDVYSSYINFEANRSESFLKLVTYGINPSYILTYENPSVLQYTNSNWIYTSEYVNYVDQIAAYYRVLGELNKAKENSLIKSYDIFGDIHRVTYENGTVLYADYKNYYVGIYKDGELVSYYNVQKVGTKEEDKEEDKDKEEETAAADDKNNASAPKPDSIDQKWEERLTKWKLLPAEKEDFEKSISAIINMEKANEFVGNAIVKEYVTRSRYMETVYSNGVTVVNDYASGDVYVIKADKAVFGYNSGTNEEFGEEKLAAFVSLLNQGK